MRWIDFQCKSALLFLQRIGNLTQVQGVSGYGHFPTAPRRLCEHLHRLGDGVDGAFPQVAEGLPRLLLADALLEGLAFVSKLDDSLGVGVEGRYRGAHAAGEGSPGHARDGRTMAEQEWHNGKKTVLT